MTFFVLGQDQSVQIENGPFHGPGALLTLDELEQALQVEPFLVVIACRDEGTAVDMSSGYEQ